MECEFCGMEPADPTVLRPVRGVLTDETGKVVGLEDAELAACEDCFADAYEPERLYRLEHECPKCWALDCRCIDKVADEVKQTRVDLYVARLGRSWGARTG